MKTELFRICNTSGKNCFVLAKDYKEAIVFAKIHGHIVGSSCNRSRGHGRVMIWTSIESTGCVTQEILDRVASMRADGIRGVVSFSVYPSGLREQSAKL